MHNIIAYQQKDHWGKDTPKPPTNSGHTNSKVTDLRGKELGRVEVDKPKRSSNCKLANQWSNNSVRCCSTCQPIIAIARYDQYRENKTLVWQFLPSHENTVQATQLRPPTNRNPPWVHRLPILQNNIIIIILLLLCMSVYIFVSLDCQVYLSIIKYPSTREGISTSPEREKLIYLSPPKLPALIARA